MKSIIYPVILVSMIFLGGAVYENIRSVYNLSDTAHPISIMVYYLMGLFWGGVAIFLKKMEKPKK